MTTIDTRHVAEFVNGLSALSDRVQTTFGFLAVLRPSDLAMESEELLVDGFPGHLPFAKTPEGDLVALRCVLGEPLARWPVVRVHHHREGAETLASSLEYLVPAWVHDYEAFFPARLAQHGPALRQLATTLGGLERTEQALARALEPKALPRGFASEADPHSPATAFYETARDALLDASEGTAHWRAFTDRFPAFVPGWMMALRCALSETQTAVARRAAWVLFARSHAHDNAWLWPDVASTSWLDERFADAARRSGERTWTSPSDVMPAVLATVAADTHPSGIHAVLHAAARRMRRAGFRGVALRRAADALADAGHHAEALEVYRSAAFARAMDDATRPARSVLDGMLRVAEAAGDAETAAVLRLARPSARGE